LFHAKDAQLTKFANVVLVVIGMVYVRCRLKMAHNSYICAIYWHIYHQNWLALCHKVLHICFSLLQTSTFFCVFTNHQRGSLFVGYSWYLHGYKSQLFYCYCNPIVLVYDVVFKLACKGWYKRSTLFK
jgi:hypothetical protein